MRKLLLLACLCLAACAHNGGADPMAVYRDAVAESILSSNPDMRDVYFVSFELADSTTKTQELDVRKNIFRAKRRIESNYADLYRRKGMGVNMEKKKASVARCETILAGLDSLSSMPDADSVVYYTARFSYIGTFSDGGKIREKDFHALVSPDGKLFKISKDVPGSEHMGCAVPGYLELLKRVGSKEEEN